ncbi:MAG: prepilin-type N-terminal cleavage/methylation domain-containing protein [Sedimentisphaerales bacterium]|nr:prepilin-type N-terminal cleavage/methylation domain-containing protein [Sedimentisphaerales bacterium]
MYTTNNKNRGFLLTETIVAVSLLGLLLAGLALSLRGLAKFNRYQLVRQRCVAAAQAQIDSIATIGEAVSDEDLNRLWPGISVSVERSPGTGQWRGLDRLDVTASGKSFRKDVTIQLSRYVQTNESSAERM